MSRRCDGVLVRVGGRGGGITYIYINDFSSIGIYDHESTITVCAVTKFTLWKMQVNCLKNVVFGLVDAVFRG